MIVVHVYYFEGQRLHYKICPSDQIINITINSVSAITCKKWCHWSVHRVFRLINVGPWADFQSSPQYLFRYQCFAYKRREIYILNDSRHLGKMYVKSFRWFTDDIKTTCNKTNKQCPPPPPKKNTQLTGIF